MAEKRKGFVLTLTDGRDVELVELAPDEVLKAMRLAPEASPGARGFAVALEGLRLSVRKVAGVSVSFEDLVGNGWKSQFKVRETIALQAAWNQIHLPTEDQVDAAREGMEVSAGSGGDLYTVTLDGLAVTFAELDVDQVQSSLRAGDRERSHAARQFAVALEGLRRAVRSLGGAPVSAEDLAGTKWSNRFTTRQTFLLARLWDEVHVGTPEENDAAGGLRAVSGT